MFFEVDLAIYGINLFRLGNPRPVGGVIPFKSGPGLALGLNALYLNETLREKEDKEI